MKPEIKKKIAILGALFTLACAPKDDSNGTHMVRIPLDDGKGNYSLQTVELKTVNDMTTLSGSVVALRTDGRFQIDEIGGGRKRLLGFDLGTVPSAHFLNVDGVLHPADFDTLAMASAAYQFENIKMFFDSIGGNDGIRFPRTILVNVSVADMTGGVVKESIDNASYESHLDMFWLNPFKSNAVPISMNGGVLAHEYFHSVFFTRLRAWQVKLDKKELPGIDVPENGKNSSGGHVALDEWSKATEDGPANLPAKFHVGECGLLRKEGDKPLFGPEDFRKLNTFIFQSLNEGVADYFGYEYTHNPHWIEASLPSQRYRDLDLAKKFDMPPEAQKCMWYMSPKMGGKKNIETDPHLVGSYFAHLFYLASKQWGSLQTEQMVLRFIDRYSEEFLKKFDSEYITVGAAVKLFFADKEPDGFLCDKVHDIFGGELNVYDYKCRGSEDLPPGNDDGEPHDMDGAATK